MIARGIKLLSTKLLDLLQLAETLGVDISTVKTYSLLKLSTWYNSMTALVTELKAWELANVGALQFSRCFTQIDEYI